MCLLCCWLWQMRLTRNIHHFLLKTETQIDSIGNLKSINNVVFDLTYFRTKSMNIFGKYLCVIVLDRAMGTNLKVSFDLWKPKNSKNLDYNFAVIVFIASIGLPHRSCEKKFYRFSKEFKTFSDQITNGEAVHKKTLFDDFNDAHDSVVTKPCGKIALKMKMNRRKIIEYAKNWLTE